MFATEAELEEKLSEPTPEAMAALASLSGDFLLLGVAGKMGPSLARMVLRALDALGKSARVMGVSRFTSGGEEELRSQGIETIRCDLLQPGEIARLPDAPNVIFMTGRKFGATGNESLTWAMNSYLPGMICQKYRHSKIVAFSTGNVYGLTAVSNKGSKEDDMPSPVGEYAMSCLGRERILEHFSRTLNIPMAFIRLNYACDLRYGVLVDLAGKVWNGEPVDLAMGYFNTLWQGDANALTLAAFCRVGSPPWVVNIAGLERLSVRTVCEQFAARWKKPVRFVGTEAESALLSDSRRAREMLGTPRVSEETLIEWVADWIERGGRQLGKPTHFESRDGRF